MSWGLNFWSKNSNAEKLVGGKSLEEIYYENFYAIEDFLKSYIMAKDLENEKNLIKYEYNPGKDTASVFLVYKSIDFSNPHSILLDGKKDLFQVKVDLDGMSVVFEESEIDRRYREENKFNVDKSPELDLYRKRLKRMGDVMTPTKRKYRLDTKKLEDVYQMVTILDKYLRGID